MKSGLALQGDLFGAVRDTVVSLVGRSSALETWGLAVVLIVLVFWVYQLVAKAIGLSGRPFFVLVPGVCLMLLAMAAVRVFWTSALLFQLGAALLVFLIAVLPLTGVLQSSSWISSLILWTLALLTAAAVLYAESVISDAIHKGAGSGSLYKQRQEQVDGIFK